MKRKITDEEFIDDIERIVNIWSTEQEARDYMPETIQNRINDRIDALTRNFFHGKRLENYYERQKRLEREQRAKGAELAEIQAERFEAARGEGKDGGGIKLPNWTEFLCRLAEKSVERTERKQRQREAAGERLPAEVKAEFIREGQNERIEERTPAPSEEIEAAAEITETEETEENDEENYEETE